MIYCAKKKKNTDLGPVPRGNEGGGLGEDVTNVLNDPGRKPDETVGLDRTDVVI